MLYVEEGGRVQSRTAHHIQDISEVKQLLPEEIYHDEDQIPDQNQSHENEHNTKEDEDLLLNLDFGPETADWMASLTRDADEILNQDL